MTRFDTDTAVTPIDEGRYSVVLDPGWWITTGPNGGYLAAIVVNAFAAAVDDPSRTCRSCTVHFLSPAVAGPAEIEVIVERSGRSMTSLSARLVQQGRTIATALAAFSTDRSGPEFVDPVMPVVPPPEELDVPGFDSSLPASAIPTMVERYEQRWAIGNRPFTGGDEALGGGWIRLAEPRPIDAAVLAAYSDAWMPVMFTRVAGAWGITTVDLTVHIRSAPPVGYDDWCLAVFRSVMSADGFCEEDGEIWTRDGRLLAQSRQLAAVITLR
jgi:acyl-CoA thioesterase